jgi:hypothetical protein
MKSIPKILFIATVISCGVEGSSDSTNAQHKQSRALPTVGVIDSLSETANDSWSGCNNHDLVSHSMSHSYSSIFKSTADGLVAWMNLNGRNVRLKLRKQISWFTANEVVYAESEYRVARTIITVRMPQYSDYTVNYKAAIRIVSGGLSRTIRAVGMPQCD